MTKEALESVVKTPVCPQCGGIVSRQAVWQQPHEQHIHYFCEQHQSVIPVFKEIPHE